MSDKTREDIHWLLRPRTIKIFWIVFILLLLLTLIADLFAHHHPYFGIDGTFGFGAWFGFLSGVLAVGGAQILGAFLKRSDDYYDH